MRSHTHTHTHVRYATNVVHCIVKNIDIVPLVLVVYYYGWMDGWMDRYCTTRVKLSEMFACGQLWYVNFVPLGIIVYYDGWMDGWVDGWVGCVVYYNKG